jgi:hypothetical protein
LLQRPHQRQRSGLGAEHVETAAHLERRPLDPERPALQSRGLEEPRGRGLVDVGKRDPQAREEQPERVRSRGIRDRGCKRARVARPCRQAQSAGCRRLLGQRALNRLPILVGSGLARAQLDAVGDVGSGPLEEAEQPRAGRSRKNRHALGPLALEPDLVRRRERRIEARRLEHRHLAPLGKRAQTEHELGDDAERAERAGVEPNQIEAGHVLDHLAAGKAERSVRERRADAEHLVAEPPIQRRVCGERVARERSSQRRRRMRSVAEHALAALMRRACELLDGQARADARNALVRVESGISQPPQIQTCDTLRVERVGPLELGAGAARHHGDLVVARPCETGRDLGRAPGPNAGLDRNPVDRVAFRVPDVLRPDDRLEGRRRHQSSTRSYSR